MATSTEPRLAGRSRRPSRCAQSDPDTGLGPGVGHDGGDLSTAAPFFRGTVADCHGEVAEIGDGDDLVRRSLRAPGRGACPDSIKRVELLPSGAVDEGAGGVGITGPVVNSEPEQRVGRERLDSPLNTNRDVHLIGEILGCHVNLRIGNRLGGHA